MCGIAGIYSYKPAAPRPDLEELRSIRDFMQNRGPDGKGEWFSADGRVALAHRRLAIIDLSDRAAQPMLSEDGQRILSFNGEIYNFHNLRKELMGKGYHFRTSSDTEVLLHLYAEYGSAMVQHLRGMFAFVLWDNHQKILLLARDPFGIKPLYYTDNGETLRIASQVKALLAGGGVSLIPEPAGITGFYLFGSVPEPWTVYRDIKAVPAGCFMVAGEQGISAPTRYFSVAETWLEAETQSQRPDQTLSGEVRNALLDSVSHHLVADVPVGAFLSSGIDSGALVGLMAELYRKAGRSTKEIQTITLTFAEFTGTANDESLLAKQLSSLYGTSHTTRVVGQDEFLQDLPKIIKAMDQPTIDGINTWFVAKAAREKGLKVAVSGLGGDELFGGYPSFKVVPTWVKWIGPFSRLPMAGDLLQKCFTHLPLLPDMFSPKTGGLLKYGTTYPGAWFLKRALFMPWELNIALDQEIFTKGLARLGIPGLVAKELDPSPLSSHGRVATLETCLYMRNQLLRDTDWASMAHSLEVRVPLVDTVLLQKLAPLLLRDPIAGKNLLGQSPRPELPLTVLQRKKTGFTTPVQFWLNSLHDLPDRLVKKQHWSRSWALTVGGERKSQQFIGSPCSGDVS